MATHATTTPTASPPNLTATTDSGAFQGFSQAAVTDPNTGTAVVTQGRLPPYTNAPLSRLASPQYPGVSALQQLFRGWMVEQPLPNQTPIDIAHRYRLLFHFNPQTISLAWDVDPSSASLPQNLPSDAASTVNRLRGVSVSFQLIFDRVGDLHRTPDGVNYDIRILDKIISGGQGGPGTSVSSGIYPSVRAVFGRTPEPGTFRPNGKVDVIHWRPNPLGFTGFIIAATWDYTRFSPDMVPTRAVANISLRADYFLPNAGPVGSSSSAAYPVTRTPASFGSNGEQLSGRGSF